MSKHLGRVAGSRNMKVSEWGAAKKLLEAGLTISQVSALSKRSWNTIQKVSQSESYKQYRELSRKYNSEHQPVMVDEPVEQPVESKPKDSAPDDTKKLMDLMTREVWALESIAKSLSALVNK